MVQLNEVVASMHVWILLYGENDPTHWIVIVHHATLYDCKLSQIFFMFPCRTDITEIPMKECSAYGEVGYSYDCDQREEPHVYELPHAQ